MWELRQARVRQTSMDRGMLSTAAVASTPRPFTNTVKNATPILSKTIVETGENRRCFRRPGGAEENAHAMAQGASSGLGFDSEYIV
jgi:hypothetical protein